ncbi:uncharacterized protein LOC128760622 isoform X2 [Synchiropus splendidus]|uniref:uncharacterized protein LOC128760622 isoform X2 n=1 Tax=Synchiropus splendidus TaxID=270530 RepID=UPI00237D7FFA|nr:uncharacterized protein LOC128760622 isoform X2 [Synchiropus splendidus]
MPWNILPKEKIKISSWQDILVTSKAWTPEAIVENEMMDIVSSRELSKDDTDIRPDDHLSASENSDASSVHIPESCDESSSYQGDDDHDDDHNRSPKQAPPYCQDANTPSKATVESSSTETSTIQEGSLYALKNYCFVCKRPQSKIARHLKKHKKEEPEIAEAFSFPKNSKERRKLLNKLRNRGNFEHNQEVQQNVDGHFKVKRRPKGSQFSVDIKRFVHCVHCKGTFVRSVLWRHTRRCPSRRSETEGCGVAKVLPLADIAESSSSSSSSSQAVSSGVWELLGQMRKDNIASVVRNDFLLLQLAQSLFNKHGSDPTKAEYIRTKVREMGRLLITLKEKYSIFAFDDAVKPGNFDKVIGAVKSVAGYDEEKHSYSIPSLALKLGHSLNKMADIILCRAISAEDEVLIKATERFKQLCTEEWSGQVSHAGLTTLSYAKFNKPSLGEIEGPDVLELDECDRDEDNVCEGSDEDKVAVDDGETTVSEKAPGPRDEEPSDRKLVSSTAASTKQEDLSLVKSEEELLPVTVTGKEDCLDGIKVGSPWSCLPSTDCPEEASQIRKRCRDANDEGMDSESPGEDSLSSLHSSVPCNVNPSEDEMHSISELVSIPLNVVRSWFEQKGSQENTEQADRISEEQGGASEPGSSSLPTSSHVDTQMTEKMESEDLQQLFQLSDGQGSSSVSVTVAPSLTTNHLGNSSNANKPSTTVAQKSKKAQNTERQKRKRSQCNFLSEMLALEKRHHKEYMEQQRHYFQLTMEEARLSREAEMALRREEAAANAAFHQAFLNVLGKIAEGFKPQSTPSSQ